jgi:CheY-like chemotaxis protein
VGLKGQLEDLPLIDMLQIIAFSKKSGYLRVGGPAGRGAVVIENGRILFAFSWSTMERVREMARDPERIRPEEKRENIEAALRELVGLREGSFQFELTDEVSDKLGGVEIKPFMIPEGIDPQELLLDLAVEIDNERREATSLLELAFQGDIPADLEELPDEREAEDELAVEPPGEPMVEPVAAELIEVVPAQEAPAEPETTDAAPEPERRGEATTDNMQGFTIVIVDDEPLVSAVLKKELEAKGFCVYVATAPAAGAEIVRMRVANGENVLAVVDLKMPTSSGRSFYGGFELIRRLKRHDIDLPVLLMVESLSDKARTRARALGVRRIVYKPTLTKPDPVLYAADLRDLAETVHGQLHKLVEDQGQTAAFGTHSDAGRIDFLATMTRQLVAPGGTADVSRLVLQVAAQFLERGLLFVVKSDGARGLAGFGFSANAAECAEKARNLLLDIGVTPAFAEAISTGTTQIARAEDGLSRALVPVMEPGESSVAVLIPVLYNRATLLLLYGDNGMSGKELGDLGGLELFMAQAGMALENKLLRSVKVEQMEMVEHLGPGT